MRKGEVTLQKPEDKEDQAALVIQKQFRKHREFKSRMQFSDPRSENERFEEMAGSVEINNKITKVRIIESKRFRN